MAQLFLHSILQKKFISIPNYVMSLSLLVETRSKSRSQAIEPTDARRFDVVPICDCSNRSSQMIDLSSNLQDSFEKIVNKLQKRYGELETVSVLEGEGSFGVVILVKTKDSKHSFMIKTQKCVSCSANSRHGELFMREINAIQKIVRDRNAMFLLPYICAYYPTQEDPFWFEERIGTQIHIKPNSKHLGLIVMEQMERAMVLNASERKKWTNDIQFIGGWLSFVWSGSLLGILGELIESNAFHSDLKEDNIVGTRVNHKDPFTFVWKAIDFGGAGTASSQSDFAQAMYTPHYGPVKPISDKQSNSNYAWSHDIVSLAHVVRNMVSFMTSTTNRVTPYSKKDNKERFLQTSNQKRLKLTNRVIEEMEPLQKKHKGVAWCMKWVQSLHTKRWNVIEWWIEMAKEWIAILEEVNETKPKIWNRIPIKPRIKKLISVIKRFK